MVDQRFQRQCKQIGQAVVWMLESVNKPIYSNCMKITFY